MKGWKFWFGLAVGVTALALFSRDLEWEPFLAAWRNIHPGWYGIGIFYFCFSFFLRCPRWKLLAEGVGAVSFSLLSRAFFVGMLVNRIFPARLGEVARCVILKRRAGLSLVGLLATVAVEKAFDGIALLTLAALSLGLLPTGDLPTNLQPLFEEHRSKILTGALGLPVVLFAAAWSLPWVLGWLEKKGFVEGMIGKFGRLARGGVGGLATLRGVKQSLGVLMWTAVVWLTLVLSADATLTAFGFDLPFSAAVVLCAAIGLAVTVPQAPSYVGVYQLAVEWTLVSIYEVPRQEAKAFAVGIWALQIIPVGVIGFACLRSLGASLKQTTEVEE